MLSRAETAFVSIAVGGFLGPLMSVAAPQVLAGQASPIAAPSTVETAVSTLPDTAPAKTSWLDQTYDKYPWLPRLLAVQFTYVGQNLFSFHASYSGTNIFLNKRQY